MTRCTPRWQIGAVLTALALAATACSGGGDDTSGDDSTPAASTQEDTGGTSEASTGEPTAPDGGATAAGADAFSQLLEERMSQTWQVEYQETGGTQAFTMANDPPNAAVAVDGQQAFVTNADGTFSCQGGQCQAVPGVDATTVMSSFLGAYAMFFSTGFGGGGIGLDVDSTTETIAGRTALCKQLSASAMAQGLAGLASGQIPDDASIDLCIDEETGVLLRATTTAEGETSGLEATSFSTTVDAALFETG